MTDKEMCDILVNQYAVVVTKYNDNLYRVTYLDTGQVSMGFVSVQEIFNIITRTRKE